MLPLSLKSSIYRRMAFPLLAAALMTNIVGCYSTRQEREVICVRASSDTVQLLLRGMRHRSSSVEPGNLYDRNRYGLATYVLNAGGNDLLPKSTTPLSPDCSSEGSMQELMTWIFFGEGFYPWAWPLLGDIAATGGPLIRTEMHLRDVSNSGEGSRPFHELFFPATSDATGRRWLPTRDGSYAVGYNDKHASLMVDLNSLRAIARSDVLTWVDRALAGPHTFPFSGRVTRKLNFLIVPEQIPDVVDISGFPRIMKSDGVARIVQRGAEPARYVPLNRGGLLLTDAEEDASDLLLLYTDNIRTPHTLTNTQRYTRLQIVDLNGNLRYQTTFERTPAASPGEYQIPELVAWDIISGRILMWSAIMHPEYLHIHESKGPQLHNGRYRLNVWDYRSGTWQMYSLVINWDYVLGKR